MATKVFSADYDPGLLAMKLFGMDSRMVRDISFDFKYGNAATV